MIWGALLLAYLLGSIPTGYLLYQLKRSKDIRLEGSGNIGTTNIARLLGFRFALMVFLTDLLKGFIPTYWIWRSYSLHFAISAGILAVIGHCYPIFLKFKGGKGVATGAGMFLALTPVPLLASLFLYLFVLRKTRISALGSLTASTSLPIFIFFSPWQTSPANQKILTGCGLLVMVFIFFQHRNNIRQLRRA